jgi:hypothetical protein
MAVMTIGMHTRTSMETATCAGTGSSYAALKRASAAGPIIENPVTNMSVGAMLTMTSDSGHGTLPHM